jgi:NAD-dependent oxidoreductase involved in siderophore biosynthesis
MTRLGTGLLDWEQGVQPAHDQLIIHAICHYEGKLSMHLRYGPAHWSGFTCDDEEEEDVSCFG